MAAISGKLARIRHTAASATSSTNEAATLSTNGVTLTINSTARRHWNRNNSTALNVFAGATEVPDGYAVNWVQGIVTFTTPRSTAVTYTIDVEWLANSFLAEGRGWTVDIDSNLHDVTTFSTTATDPKWRTFIAGLNSATVTIDKLVKSGDTGPLFTDRAIAQTDLVVELITDNANARKYEAYARVAGVSPSVGIDGVAEESVTLQIDDTLYFSTV